MAFTGPQYQTTRSMSCAQLAKLMRAEIAKIELPYGVTVGVRSTHSSIDISVRGLGDARIYLPQDEDDRMYHRRPEFTSLAATLKAKLDAIHGAYQYDDSDVQTDHFDRRYYGAVSFDSDQHAAFQATQKTEADARREALKVEKAKATAAPFRAHVTNRGLGILDAATQRQVALIKVRPYVLRKGLKQAEAGYLLHCAGYEVVRYDRTTRSYAITRTWTVPVTEVA